MTLPIAFYPDYRRHGVRDASQFVYEFAYEVTIVSETQICNLSIPDQAEIAEKDETNTRIVVRCTSPSRQIDLYYRTADMLVPQLLYAKSPDSHEVACSAALVPTFDPVSPQDFFKLSKDEKPESASLSPGDDYHFIFLVDRSGSMGCGRRMKIARDALILFMRSLPKNCVYSIISFGSRYEALK